MTTIAWDGAAVAADSMALTGVYKNPLNVTKLRREKNTVFALCGDSCMLDPLVRWYLSGAAPDKMPTAKDVDFAFIVFNAAGTAAYYVQDCPYPSEPGAPDAWGSGAGFAIGAMMHGADAFEAVHVACKANPSGTAPPVYGYRLVSGYWDGFEA